MNTETSCSRLLAAAKVHFIGIGGYGMSSLAAILISRGVEVSGSDLRRSARTKRLAEQGAHIALGHRQENVPEADMVIYSNAVAEDNPELLAARQKNIAVIGRAEALGCLFNEALGIAIAGTHGKTTTSAMVLHVLRSSGIDASGAIGGEPIDGRTGGGVAGASNWFVAEADEAYGSFLHLLPYAAVVTNIDDDHQDHYGSPEGVVAAFRRFIQQVRPDGLLVYLGDEDTARGVCEKSKAACLSYGFGSANSAICRIIEEASDRTSFSVCLNGVTSRGLIRIPGAHSVLNATAAAVVSSVAGIALPDALLALESFAGTKRRSELLGIARGVSVYDDYAHHPAEIEATTLGLRARSPGRLIAVFQPQRYSRTRLLFDRFAAAFRNVDAVILDDIYYEGTGESPLPGVSSEKLAERIRKESCIECIYIAGADSIADYVCPLLGVGDTVVTMGAGDIRTAAERILGKLGDTDEHV